ncbi:MAG TPA: aspartate--tRNA ligase [Gemmatimonadales bacterium]|nr:aspartate--tRNA ligase [Gemmatimonadales bacterium]
MGCDRRLPLPPFPPPRSGPRDSIVRGSTTPTRPRPVVEDRRHRMTGSSQTRSHRCGELTTGHVGQHVTLGGWVHRRRDLGGLVFLDLRDRTGLVQLSCDPAYAGPDLMARAANVGVEEVLLIEGEVVRRPEAARDPAMATRDVEVQVRSLEVVGPAITPPIQVAFKEGEALPAEELRLKYRVLDLRRPDLQQNLILRHRLLQRARRSLSDQGFLEIETPILTKPTPEGARDYLVPSRIHPGEFFALPQSPQIYKQLLMVAGYDRYFQVARCFRDEDLRADRQPEFTQIDIEASFVSAIDVHGFVEQVLVDLWDEAGHAVARPFPHLTYADAMERYGVDKPDLRFGWAIRDLTPAVNESGGEGSAAPFVASALAAGGRLRGIVVPGGATFSRREIDALTEAARGAGAGGLMWARRTDAGWEGQGVKAVGHDVLARIEGAAGDLLLAAVGSDQLTSAALAAVRTGLTARPEATPDLQHAFCWIVDFPLFELDPESGKSVPAHHPFTAPHPEDRGLLERDPARCRSTHYDVVYNGSELGSGSIRITDIELQRRIFTMLGMSEADIDRRFGFLLNGLRYGAPPHGGFAIGFDRVVMLLAGAQSLRDVIAFPKTAGGRALFEGAPTPVDPNEMAELHLELKRR